MAKRSGLPVSRAGSRRRGLSAIFGVTLGRLLSWAFTLISITLILGAVGFAVFVLYPVKTIPAFEKVDAYAYLDQGWGSTADTPDRQTYYYTPQGASLPQGALTTPLRYNWFVNLEMP
ncbi:MAG: hypothetical protein ABIR27_09070, partial [Dokdonella sp.]